MHARKARVVGASHAGGAVEWRKMWRGGFDQSLVREVVVGVRFDFGKPSRSWLLLGHAWAGAGLARNDRGSRECKYV